MTSPSEDSDGGFPHEDAETKARSLVCARCGKRAAGREPTWTFSVENGVRQYFCDVCSREHLRAIEGRLDSAWW